MLHHYTRIRILGEVAIFSRDLYIILAPTTPKDAPPTPLPVIMFEVFFVLEIAFIVLKRELLASHNIRCTTF